MSCQDVILEMYFKSEFCKGCPTECGCREPPRWDNAMVDLCRMSIIYNYYILDATGGRIEKSTKAELFFVDHGLIA